jgi:hypothetical protein
MVTSDKIILHEKPKKMYFLASPTGAHGGRSMKHGKAVWMNNAAQRGAQKNLH